jgi:hypothetical protein
LAYNLSTVCYAEAFLIGLHWAVCFQLTGGDK